MSEPTDHEITCVNLLTELERLYDELREADAITIKRFASLGQRTWGIDGHILVRMGSCVLVAKDLAGIGHRYSEATPYHVKSNRLLRDENRELRRQNDDLRTTVTTLATIMDVPVQLPIPVLKEHERRET